MDKLFDLMCKFCIKIANWSSHPLAIILLPVSCIIYLQYGGQEGYLTLILSILAISLTQMVLRAQTLDTEANKLQIAELIKATPEARNEVINSELSEKEIFKMRKELEDELSSRV